MSIERQYCYYLEISLAAVYVFPFGEPNFFEKAGYMFLVNINEVLINIITIILTMSTEGEDPWVDV